RRRPGARRRRVVPTDGRRRPRRRGEGCTPVSREYDVVLLGASGFTGALTAEYLRKNAPEGLRWAVAGRNKSKLEQFGEDILYADVTDPKSLRELAESTKVVATTVGPYVQYGEPLVAACAEAGTG